VVGLVSLALSQVVTLDLHFVWVRVVSNVITAFRVGRFGSIFYC
jgi:hypothetical protein